MKRLLISVFVGLALAGSVPAQYHLPEPPPVPPVQPPTPLAFAPPVVEDGEDRGAPLSVRWRQFKWMHSEDAISAIRSGVRIDAEYLWWYFRPNNVASPVLTTLSPAAAAQLPVLNPANLAVGNATILYGGNDARDQGLTPGLRVLFGVDLDLEGCFGLEATFMALPRRGDRVRINSDGVGSALGLPIANPNLAPLLNVPQGETAVVLAGPVNGGVQRGQFDAYTATQLYGTELNVTADLCRTDRVRYEAIAGFRYQAMEDLLTIVAQSTGGANNFSTSDRFNTSNHYFGGQLGGRFTYLVGRLAAVTTTKVALGGNSSTVSLSGFSALPPGVGTGQPGGFYTGPTNLGTTTADRFSVMTDLNFTLKFAITPRIVMTGGYNFLYWTGIQRTGDQVSRLINPTQSPVLSPGTGAVPGSGIGAPSPPNEVGEFWAHGLNAGLEFRF